MIPSLSLNVTETTVPVTLYGTQTCHKTKICILTRSIDLKSRLFIVSRCVYFAKLKLYKLQNT